MKFIKILLFVLLFALGIYATFSLKAYFDYKNNYLDCEKFRDIGVLPDPKLVCSDTNYRLFWKILFPFGIPSYPRGYLM